jgi:hypothetical protein
MPHKKHIDSTEDVIHALGGDQNVADILGVHRKAVSNWRYFKVFPASTYLVIKQLLKKRGKDAPDTLWAMRGPKR